MIVTGPGQEKSLPTTPKFTWDLKTVPWTDGRGDQEEFSNAVDKWAAFHDSFKDSNSNKIDKSQRRLIIHTQLFGRAADLTA